MALETVNASNLVGSSYGRPSIGLSASVMGRFGSPIQDEIKATETASSTSIGGQKSVLWGVGVLVVLLFLLSFVAKRFGEEGDFRSIRGSFYNTFLIGLSATIMIPLLKFFFGAKQGKVKLPGIGAWIDAA